MIPCPIPDGKQISFRVAGILDSKKGNRYTAPAQRDCVTDYVNEKRLEELREEIRDDGSRSVWKHLLPWEKAALPPETDEKRAAEEILCAYMDKHEISL